MNITKIITLCAMLWGCGASLLMAETQTDSLATYIAAAIRNNPAVIGQYHAYKAQVMAACGEGQLNDPEITVNAFPSPMQHVNVKQYATVTAMQMFPWFGTLKAGREMMEHKAEAAYQKFREAGIALAFDVQRQWYKLLSTQDKIRSVHDKLSLLKDIEQVALYQYKSPLTARGTKMSDQLRLQSEEARLEEQIASLQDEMKLQQQQLNLTMHRDPESPLALPDSISLRDMPVMAWDEIERQDPRLNALRANGRAYDAQAAKARGMGMLMIGVGLQYMMNGKVDHPLMADMNGNDMIMPMIKVTLPIYRRRVNAARRSAALMKQSTEWNYQEEQDRLRGRYLSIRQRAADEQRKLELYRKEVAILHNTLHLMTSEYANGTTSLTDLLQTMREQIDYTLKQAEAYAAYNTIVAEYEEMASKYDYAVRADQEMKNHQTTDSHE